MHRSPFVFNIGDLLRPSALPRPVSIEASVEWAVELSRTLATPPLTADLVLAPTSGGLLVTGSADVAVTHVCHRCLRSIEDEVHVEIAQLYVRPDDLDGDVEYELSGDEVDLEPMVRDEVLLAMPLLPVCGGDCPGPPEAASAEGNDEESASPFSVLRDLFEEG